MAGSALDASLVMEASTHLLHTCGQVLSRAERQRPKLAQRAPGPAHQHSPVSSGRQPAESLLQARQQSGLRASTSQPSRGASTRAAATETPQLEEPPGPRDDDCLPDSLSEALVHAAHATNQALDGPGGRYLVRPYTGTAPLTAGRGSVSATV